MDLGLEGRTAFVGASSKGLGYAAAHALAAEGAAVAVVARTAPEVEAAAARIASETGARTLAVCADLATPEGIERAVAETVAALGAPSVVVANGGGPPAGTFDTTDDAAWMAAAEGTLLATVRLIRATLPAMRAARWGRVIAITSTSVRHPIAGLMLSNSIRAGVVGMLKTLAAEVAADGVTVNNVAPGSYATDRLKHLHDVQAAAAGITFEEARARAVARIPAGRLGDPRELGAAIAFLASAQASYITGQTILVDGGQTPGV